MLLSAVCPSVSALTSAEYTRLVDRCYALSTLRYSQQADNSLNKLYIHALRARYTAADSNQPHSHSLPHSHSHSQSATDTSLARCVAVAVYDETVTRLLADRLQLTRLAAAQRRVWFEVFERRVAAREERIESMERERAALVEQWRGKQRALEHEVSRLRVELKLNSNAANHQTAAEQHVRTTGAL